MEVGQVGEGGFSGQQVGRREGRNPLVERSQTSMVARSR